MIPVLFDKNETSFSTQGVGALSDTLECTVIEQRNGAYELEMKYPVDGIHYSHIVMDSFIYAQPHQKDDPEPFRVYRISKPINGVVSIYCRHRSYELSNMLVAPFNATGVYPALYGLIQNSVTENEYEVWTDISNSASNFSAKVPDSFRRNLAGKQGSILDVFGGEFKWNNRKISLYRNRGSDRGVRIEYGKNLTNIKQEENISNVVTGVYPYWLSTEGDELVELPEQIVESEYADRYPFKRNIPLDLSTEFDLKPSTEQLREKAQSYVDSEIGVPEVSITVSFVNLSDTDEYKDLTQERIDLCDTVTVFFKALGVDAKAKVIETKYDVLSERYESIKIGTVRTTIADTVADIQNKQENQVTDTRSMLERALDAQQKIMSGAVGGYFVTTYNAEGMPSEITFGDTDNINTMVHCIRINRNGIAFSDTGFYGTFNSAWTIDGTFSAENINAGYLSSERIAAGSILVSQLDESLQNLAQSVSVAPDGVHISKLGEGVAIEAVMEADGLHLYYTTGESKAQLAYFTTYETRIKNAHIDNYLYIAQHRIERLRTKKMSDGTYAYATSFFAGGNEA